MRLQKIIAAWTLLAASCLPSHSSAGELTYSDVDTARLMGWLLSGQPEQAASEASQIIDGLRPTNDPATIYMIGEALTYRCEAHSQLDWHEKAKADCLDAIATFEEVGSNLHTKDWRHKRAETLLAAAYVDLGEIEPAIALLTSQFEEINCGRICNAERAQLLAHIGDLQAVQGDFREAEKSYLEAISFLPDGEQEDPDSLVLPHLNLAKLYILEERFAEAEAALKEGIATSTSAAREPSVLHEFRTALFSQSLGWTYFHQGRYDEAREVGRTAFHKFRESEDSRLRYSVHFIDTLVLLARIEDAGQPGSAAGRRYLETAVGRGFSGAGLGDVYHAVAQYEFARHHVLAGNDVAAEPYARIAVRTLLWETGNDNLYTARARMILARVLQLQSQDEEALDHANSAFATQWSYLPPYHSEIGETLALMAELYEALGDKENLRATRILIEDHRKARAAFEATR